MGERQDKVWQRADLVETFIRDVRGGVPFGLEQIEIALRVIAASGPVHRFVDLGCGAGVMARAILDRHPHARGVLVDFSEPMLSEARRHLSPWADQLSFEIADLADSSWSRRLPPGSFDSIVSAYAIHHLTHDRKRSLYAEIFDLLAPGGLFLNIEHVASPSAWIERASDELFVDSLWPFQQQRQPEKTREQVASEFATRPDKAANILAPVEEQCGWLRTIGYDNVDCFFKVFELAVFGGRRPT